MSSAYLSKKAVTPPMVIYPFVVLGSLFVIIINQTQCKDNKLNENERTKNDFFLFYEFSYLCHKN